MKKLLFIMAGAFALATESFLLPGILNSPAIIADCNQTIYKNKFSICYNYDKQSPIFSFYKLTSADILKPKQKREYLRTEKSIPKKYRPSYTKYSKSSFDAGHLPAAASVDTSKEEADDVYIVNFCAPQNPILNRKVWLAIEREERRLALLSGEIYIITGVLPGTQKISNLIEVPSYFFKMIYIPGKRSWVDWLAPNQTWDHNNSLNQEEYKIDHNALLNIIKQYNVKLKFLNFN